MRLLFAFLLIALPFGAEHARADSAPPVEESWRPKKAIMIIAPSNPGGGWDQTARFLQQAMIAENLSPTPVEVVNRGGAGGTIALAELVDRYRGDPYKLMIGGFGLTGAVLMHGAGHSIESTTLIARLTSEFEVIAVPSNSPFKTLSDLLDAFRRDPKSITWGGGSAGSADHIFLNIVAEKIGVRSADITYVAFTGGGEAAAAVMGRQVTVGISGYSEYIGLAEAGRMRILGVSSLTRVVDPITPTLREAGVDVVFENWRCILAAPNLSPDERAWLTNAVTKAAASPVWRKALERNNWHDRFLSGDEFDKFVSADSVTTGRILNRIGLGEKGKGYAVIGPYFFPLVIGMGLTLSTAHLVYAGVRRRRVAAISMAADSKPSFQRAGVAALIVLIYIGAISIIGFIFVTPIFITTMSRVIGSRAPVRDLGIGVALTFCITLIFEQLLGVDVP